MPSIVVVDQSGTEHIVNARAGCRVMEILRELDYGVAAVCGGLCACATCHVYVDERWTAQLPDKQSDEQDALSVLSHYREAVSRLSCQVIMTAELHGLRVTIAPDE